MGSISNMKHLPRSLAAQVKATCQKRASRGNVLSTSYKDTPQSMQVGGAQHEFLQALAFALDQSWSISAKRDQNCIIQVLRNKKCSLFRKGREEQK